MSEVWEKSIQEWYLKSRTSNLEYLNLEESSKVTNTQISHNLSVVYDKVCLSSRVHLKYFKSILEQIELLKSENIKILKILKNLQKELQQKEEVTTLVKEISKQSKLVEKQALTLTTELNQKLDRVEKLLHKIENWTST